MWERALALVGLLLVGWSFYEAAMTGVQRQIAMSSLLLVCFGLLVLYPTWGRMPKIARVLAILFFVTGAGVASGLVG
jgi:glucan phosphoethanolaminetransferase (alkaline phosphatase superfamily)